jgi:hypothetical protein
MNRLSKLFALMCLVFFIASLVVLSQNVKALPEPSHLNPSLTLNVLKITDTTVTLSWTKDQLPEEFVPFHPQVPYFNSYTLRTSPQALDYQYPYGYSTYKDVWSTSDVNQTTTTLTNLTSSTKYYFFIFSSDYFGGEFSNMVEVQTLPSPTSLPTPTPTLTPTSTPTVPEFSWLAILPLFITFLFVAFSVTVYRRHRKTANLAK